MDDFKNANDDRQGAGAPSKKMGVPPVSEITIVIGLLALVALLQVKFAADWDKSYVWLLPILFGLLGMGARQAFLYLQAEREAYPGMSRFSEVEGRLDNLEDKVARKAGLTPEERLNIALSVEQQTAKSVRVELAREWEEKYLAKALKDRHLDYLRRVAEEVKMRLVDEVHALGKRANLNLVVGGTVSVVGLIALGWFVIIASSEFQGEMTVAGVALRFGIRLSRQKQISGMFASLTQMDASGFRTETWRATAPPPMKGSRYSSITVGKTASS